MSTKLKKQMCRLCYCETTDTVNIFDDDRGLYFQEKINKYLYLNVSNEDSYPKTICWMCSQQLEKFHQFFEKINETQQANLKDDYKFVVLHAVYERIDPSIAEVNSNVVAQKDEENDDMVELLFVTDDFGDAEESADTKPVINDCSAKLSDGVEVTVVQSNNGNNDLITEDIIHESMKQKKDKVINLVKGIDEKTGEETFFIQQFPDDEDEDGTVTLDVCHRKSGRKSEMECRKTTTNTKTFEPRQTRSGRTIKTPLILDGVKTRKTVKKRNNVNLYDDPSDSESAQINVKSEDTVSDEDNCKTEDRVCGTKQKPKKRTTQMQIAHSQGQVLDEGESDNEFPTRDSDYDDWPPPETFNEFPKTLIKNGVLAIKGKALMDLINKFYKLECDMCKDRPRYKHFKDLFEHYDKSHKEIGYVTCCQTKLNRYPSIIMHMARHIQPEPFKCDECGYMVTRPRFLERHKQTHLPEDQKPYACDKCPRRFCWKGAMQIHMISHQPIEERKHYVCVTCGKKYDTPGGLSTHKKQIHSAKPKTESNVCHVCAKIFSTRTGLHEHMSTIHQPREMGQLQCKKCGKWLMNYRCLKTHMILHSDAKFDCTVCEYTTKKKFLLDRHMVAQHSDDKPFVCHVCARAFKMKRALTLHLVKHITTTTYKCPFCEREFNSSTNFYTHRKSAHPEELAAMKIQEQELKRQKRIAAGIEDPLYEQSSSEDKGEVECIEALPIELTEEITIINIDDERDITGDIGLPISIIDQNGIVLSTDNLLSKHIENEPFTIEVSKDRGKRKIKKRNRI